MRSSVFPALGLVLAAFTADAQSPLRERPTLVLTNAKVFTADTTRPWAEAVAIRGERIVAVGSSAEIAKLAGPATRRVDLRGRVVVPGLNDAHAHMGCLNTRTKWAGADDPFSDPLLDPPVAVLTDSLRALAAREREGTWLALGMGTTAMEDTSLRRAVLDRIAPRHPVTLLLAGGHGAVLNTAALRELGITDSATDPVGGRYMREPGSRRLDGAMVEYAAFAVSRHYCSDAPESAIVRAVQTQGAWMLRHGMTSVQTFNNTLGPAQGLRVFQAARLPLRVRVIPTPLTGPSGRLLTEWRELDSAGRARPAAGGMLTVSGVKWVLDGTPIERGAAHRTPYRDRPGHFGVIDFPPDTIRAMLLEARDAGQQPMLHAGGDSTLVVLLDQLERTGGAAAWRAVRPRVEHGDGLFPDLIERARRLGVVIVQNPVHFGIADMVHARYDSVSRAGFQPVRSLLAAGIPVAFGADANGEGMNPFLNIMLATVHPTNPKEALTREQAVTAYTRGSAYAEMAEREKGTLAPGMLADIAVLSQDIFTVPAPQLPATTSVLTIVGGRIVHDELTPPRMLRRRP